MNRVLADRIARALDGSVVQTSPVAGGDINAALCAQLSDGRRVFVKTQSRPLPGMFAHEASGLGWLADARALRVPQVLASSDDPGCAFLALEWIEPGRPRADHAEQLGRGLAQLHRHGAPSFGLDHDNYLATLPQLNQALGRWPEFYAQRRLGPLLARAVDCGTASARVQRGIERVIARIDALCGPDEPPARLHGDLWGGNALCDEAGAPVLIDPAVYGGHREVDLAMMRLFGRFAQRAFDAYDEAYPLAPGHEDRIPLYQLYPLLAHVNLF
ncbi:MAG TPA: fructosamine kinase family protein, partial [Polyangiales bacterium]|nr:fructosamine kinase family protein [Polyangiales bacterium]